MPLSNDSPIASPLETSGTDAITELFNRDPITWSKEEKVRAIDHWRSLRLTIGDDQRSKRVTKEPKPDVSGKSAEEILGMLDLKLPGV